MARNSSVYCVAKSHGCKTLHYEKESRASYTRTFFPCEFSFVHTQDSQAYAKNLNICKRKYFWSKKALVMVFIAFRMLENQRSILNDRVTKSKFLRYFHKRSRLKITTFVADVAFSQWNGTVFSNFWSTQLDLLHFETLKQKVVNLISIPSSTRTMGSSNYRVYFNSPMSQYMRLIFIVYNQKNLRALLFE